jgi:predicted nuclease with TOPRIM domain
MNNQQLFLIIIALLAIIPAGVVFLVMWTRQMAQERRIEAATVAKGALDAVQQEQKNIFAEISKRDAKLNSLEESFANLNSKLNSRARVEQMAEKRTKKTEDEEKSEQLDWTKLPGAFPLEPQREPGNGGEQPRRMVLRPKSY